MAWNGGVSLAVWMGGVAVELAAAQGARTSPGPDPTAPPPCAPASVRSTGAVYNALCSAFDRMFVPDIIVGASAGGLNGALLAGSIVHDVPLEASFLRERWIDIGDFEVLLQPIGVEKPPSILQGDLFHRKMVEAFDVLLREPSGEPCEGEDTREARVLLDVQMTDVAGQERCFVDNWDQPFYAREYRAPIKFRRVCDYAVETLATAARASSSFPAAFAPQQVAGRTAALAGRAGMVRWAVDGGLLENAPIKPALELIPTRRASGPVKRVVCYVNAAPTQHSADEEVPDQPQLAAVLGYVVNLPRVGRTIDQLTAMDDARRRAGVGASTGIDLLRATPDCLMAIARSLLSTYQHRRALLSLEEMLSGAEWHAGPGFARRLYDLLPEPTALPWIPQAIDVDGTWNWGARPAQRILQLELDLLRAALNAPGAGTEDARRIFTARGPIDDALDHLEEIHADWMRPGGSAWNAVQDFRFGAGESALTTLKELHEGEAVKIETFLR